MAPGYQGPSLVLDALCGISCGCEPDGAIRRRHDSSLKFIATNRSSGEHPEQELHKSSLDDYTILETVPRMTK
jgi:hypothetical protein